MIRGRSVITWLIAGYFYLNWGINSASEMKKRKTRDFLNYSGSMNTDKKIEDREHWRLDSFLKVGTG